MSQFGMGYGDGANFLLNIGGGSGSSTLQNQQSGLSAGINGSSSLGTGSSQSQYLIPGAKPAYQDIYSGLNREYGLASNNLGNLYGSWAPAVTGGYQDLFNQGMQDVQNYGQTQQAQLNNAYAQAGSQQNQSLADRGLGNTTVQNAVDSGLLQNKELAQTNLNQGISQYKLNARNQMGGALLGAVQGIGQNMTGQQLGLMQGGLNAQQALGQEYLGLVGQEGIRNTTNQQAQQNQGYQLQGQSSRSNTLETHNNTQASATTQPQNIYNNYGGGGGGGSNNPQPTQGGGGGTMTGTGSIPGSVPPGTQTTGMSTGNNYYGGSNNPQGMTGGTGPTAGPGGTPSMSTGGNYYGGSNTTVNAPNYGGGYGGAYPGPNSGYPDGPLPNQGYNTPLPPNSGWNGGSQAASPDDSSSTMEGTYIPNGSSGHPESRPIPTTPPSSGQEQLDPNWHPGVGQTHPGQPGFVLPPSNAGPTQPLGGMFGPPQQGGGANMATRGGPSRPVRGPGGSGTPSRPVMGRPSPGSMPTARPVNPGPNYGVIGAPQRPMMPGNPSRPITPGGGIGASGPPQASTPGISYGPNMATGNGGFGSFGAGSNAGGFNGTTPSGQFQQFGQGYAGPAGSGSAVTNPNYDQYGNWKGKPGANMPGWPTGSRPGWH